MTSDQRLVALQQLFQATFDPVESTRKAAETALFTNERSEPDFLRTVLTLIATQDAIDTGARQAAAVYFKNRVVKHWSPSPHAVNVVTIPDEERAFIRSNILSALGSSSGNQNISSQLQSALQTIVSSDYPKKWNQILADSAQLLTNTSSTMQVFAGLQGLLALVKRYRWTKFDKQTSSEVDNIVKTAFGPLVVVVQQAASHNSSQALQFVYLAYKIFLKVIINSIPSSLQSSAALGQWLQCMLQTLAAQSTEDADNTDVRNREKAPVFAAKKWALKIIHKLIGRYGCPSTITAKSLGPEMNEFAQRFQTEFAPTILNSCLNAVSHYVGGQSWLGPRALTQLIGTFEEGIKEPGTWQIILQHLEPIIQQVIFPRLWFTEDDVDNFANNPVEYVSVSNDPYDDTSSAKFAASSFVYELISGRRKSVFAPIIGFIGQALSDRSNIRAKYGAMHLLSGIAGLILVKESDARRQIEDALVSFVFPELQAAEGLMRAKALQTLSSFWQLEYRNPDSFKAVVEGVVSRLADSKLPVRIQAASSLNQLLRRNVVHDIVRPVLSQVVQMLLELMPLVDTDILPMLLDTIIDTFPTELEPYAAQVTQQMVSNYRRVVASLTGDADLAPEASTDNDSGGSAADKASAAMGMLKAIDTLVINFADSPHVVENIEAIAAPAIQMTFANDVIDVYESALELLESFIYVRKTVSQATWTIFEPLVATVMNFSHEVAIIAVPVLRMYMIYGGGPAISSRHAQLSTLLNAYGPIIEDETNVYDELSIVCELFEDMFLSLPGQIDWVISAVPNLGRSLLKRAEDIDSPSLCVRALEVILAALLNNTPATLNALAQQNMLQPVLIALSDKCIHFTRVYDRRIVVLSMLAVLAMPEQQLPDMLKTSDALKHILNIISNRLNGYVKAEERRAKVIKEIIGDDVENELAANRLPVVDQSEDVDQYEVIASGASSRTTSNRTFGTDGDADNDEVDEYDDDDEEDDEEEEEEELEEDPYMSKAIDSIDPIGRFKDVYNHMQQQSPAMFQLMVNGLSQDLQASIMSINATVGRQH
ncbi:ARM repeat-containing protein [Ramicandelaber brevisporus]|nr:ARM repeat-containing protein [Ramicandelaber brevisporus]